MCDRRSRLSPPLKEFAQPLGRPATLLLLLALLLTVGPAAAQTGESAPAGMGNPVYAELAKAPQKAAARHNPLEKDPDAVPAGAKLFGQHCAECHGEDASGGRGGKKGPSLRAPEVQRATPGSLFWLLTNGVVRRGMPVWSRLPEPQRWQLVSYIKSLNAKRTDSESGSP